MNINKDIDQTYWRIQKGNSSFLWDNWTSLGSISTLCNYNVLHKTMVSHFIPNNNWDIAKLSQCIPDHLVNHIKGIKIVISNKLDQAVQTGATNGEFTYSSTWNALRQRKVSLLLTRICGIRLSLFKISFFNQKLLIYKLPTDDNIRNLTFSYPSRCDCCDIPMSEDVNHIFRSNKLSKNIWNIFRTSLELKNLEGKLDMRC